MIVAAVSVWPNALMNCAPGNASTALLMVSNGMGAAPYVITLRLLRSRRPKSSWSMSIFSIVGTIMALSARSSSTSCIHSAGSNWRWTMSVLPP